MEGSKLKAEGSKVKEKIGQGSKLKARHTLPPQCMYPRCTLMVLWGKLIADRKKAGSW